MKKLIAIICCVVMFMLSCNDYKTPTIEWEDVDTTYNDTTVVDTLYVDNYGDLNIVTKDIVVTPCHSYLSFLK